MTTLYAQNGGNEVNIVAWDLNPGGGSPQAPVSGDALNLNGQSGISFNNTSAFADISFMVGSPTDSIRLDVGSETCNITTGCTVTLGGSIALSAKTWVLSYTFSPGGNTLTVSGTGVVRFESYGQSLASGLAINAGGTVEVYTSAMSNMGLGSLSGTLRIYNGGSWTTTGGGFQIESGATLNVEEGSFDESTSITNAGGTLILGDLSSHVGDVTVGAYVQSSGTTTINAGTLTVNGGQMTFTTGALTVGDYGQIDHASGYSVLFGLTPTFSALSPRIKLSGYDITGFIPVAYRTEAYGGDIPESYIVDSGPGAAGGGTLAVGNVLSSDPCGAGTYVVAIASDVRDGTTFGAAGALTGVLELPAEADVRSGTGYGADGTEFTGTLDASGGVPAGLEDIIPRFITPQPGETTQEQVDRMHERWFSA